MYKKSRCVSSYSFITFIANSKLNIILKDRKNCVRVSLIIALLLLLF